MKSSSSAPAPDANIGKAALKQAETGEQWLSFAQDAFAVSNKRQAELDALTTQVTKQQLGLATDQADWARSDRERYESVYKPVEDQFVQEASNYGTAERQAEAAAEARGDVQSAAANARAATERNNAAMGIDPRSGRAAGVTATTDMNVTLAEASAANNARTAVRDKGLALKADVANLGRGLPANAAAGAAGSVSASGTALGGAQASNAQAMAAPSIVSQGYSGAMQGYAGMGSTLNQQYGLQLDGWKTEQSMAAQGAAGIGSFLGGVMGIMSDENVKHDVSEIEEGKALDAVKNMPVSEWTYDEGVADGGRHVGTMAQDFQRETGKGDGRSIPVGDAIGVTMKAVQDLDSKVDRLVDAIGLALPTRERKKPAQKAGEPMMKEAA
ncbi:tail fiber domain-containing protein [Rhizobium sp. 18065]|uniref:tail fiber domain-containing protein n=1 Tax=Rhizobium sp. 18065 TaxID=2681411 RepID=UPI00135AFEFE|nr:tail fiber domain-containing protein [Rhizobium sp. 18065]